MLTSMTLALAVLRRSLRTVGDKASSSMRVSFESRNFGRLRDETKRNKTIENALSVSQSFNVHVAA
jgi:hypothetical protein